MVSPHGRVGGKENIVRKRFFTGHGLAPALTISEDGVNHGKLSGGTAGAGVGSEGGVGRMREWKERRWECRKDEGHRLRR